MSKRYDYEYSNFEYKGFTVRIIQDIDVEDPAYDDDDAECFLSASNTDGHIGKKNYEHQGQHHVPWGQYMWGHYGKEIPDESNEEAWEYYCEWRDQYEPEYQVWPITYGNAHGPGSGTIYEVDEDDYSDLADIDGYIYIRVPVSDVEKLADSDRDLEKMKDSLIDMYQTWLRGEVYGYVIEDTDGNELESCWSFWGDEDCVKEARHVIDTYPSLNGFKTQRKFVVIKPDGKWEYVYIDVPMYVGDGSMLEWFRENHGVGEDCQIEEESTSLPLFTLLKEVETKYAQ